MKRTLVLLMLTCLLFVAAVGCVDREQSKADLTNALSRHSDMNSYSFSGTARLSVHSSSSNLHAANPLSEGLIRMLLRSEIAWNGVASIAPLRMEALIHIAPEDSTTVYEIPVLLKDNMMYIHIPILNQENQYVEIDFQALSELSGKTNQTTRQLSDAGKLFADIAGALVTSIDASQYNKAKLNEETGMNQITVSIKPDDRKSAIELWFAAMPLIAERLVDSGYVTSEAADRWSGSWSAEERARLAQQEDALRLEQPLSLSALIDGQGFIREMRLNADLAWRDQAGEMNSWKADIANYYDQINEDPPFVYSVPEDVVSFTEILKLLSSSQ